MSNFLKTLLLVCSGVLCPAIHSQAADYLFGVPELEMQVWVRRDASVRIVYDITFENSRHGHPIDVVDIGVPHAGYKLESVRASMAGQSLSDIRTSTVVNPGFEVHLDAETIPPGKSGTLHVEFPMPDMVWQDTTRRDYASLQIAPVWFGSQYVTGTSHVRVAMVLPTGVKPDEAIYQGNPFSQKALMKLAEQPGGEAREHAVVVWDRQLRLVEQHKFGASFPKRGLERVVYLTPLGLALKWFAESPQARLMAGVVFLVLFAFLFFRFSGGTGLSVFFVLSVGAAIVFAASPGWHLLSFPLVVLLIAWNEWKLGRRKTGYMPPIASVEGGGIKRGLTAPEAAAILEMPLSKVLGLVIFGLLKKGALRQLQASPLVVEVDEAFRVPEGTLVPDQAKFYRDAALQKKTVIHRYEFPFLWLVQNRPGKPAPEIDFSPPLRQLLTQTAAVLKGFDLGQTREYYRSIVRRAADQAGSIADIPQREKQIDRNFEWILLDPRYPDVFDYGRPYRPVWTRYDTYSGGGSSAPAAPSAPSPPSPAGQTTFGEVAASFSGWAENAMGGLASSISPAALNLPQPSGGFLNLSAADHVTGELFKALAEASASGGKGGGGGGGGCACACAGCACACACAGGGR